MEFREVLVFEPGIISGWMELFKNFRPRGVRRRLFDLLIKFNRRMQTTETNYLKSRVSFKYRFWGLRFVHHR